jgi:O-antigen ligase
LTLPVAALAALATLPLLAAFVARPARTILPLYAATLPIASVVRLSVPFPEPFNTLSSLLGGLVILAGVGHVVLYRRGRIPTLPVAAWMLFLTWATLSAFWALSARSAVEELVLAVPLLSLLVVVSLVPASEADLDALRVGIIVGGIVVGLYALSLLPGENLPTHGVTQRLSVASDPREANPNILAASLLLPAVLSLERLMLGGTRWWSARSWRVLGGSGLLLSCTAILLTGSRGGLLACTIAVAVVIANARHLPGVREIARRTAWGIVGTVALVFVAGAAVMALAPQSATARVIASDTLTRITRTQDDGSGRLEIWTVGKRACQLHCAFGAGFGNFPHAYTDAFAFSGAQKNVGLDRPAHNVYLSLAVETGVVGLTFFGMALALEWISLRRPRMHQVAPALRGAVIAIFVAEMFLSAIWFKYFWLVFVMIRVAEGAAAERPGRPPIPVDYPPRAIAAKPA